ncbi:hypothetical protein WMF18_00800 [Sorangium sp. So ce315]|uniref:hypothetical protein n=1 Tax=Sorangium sp. So ce315 TaxID=3133299 RepID=UPI003F611444
MGCDIHMFAEFGEGSGAFTALSDGEFLLPRQYGLFAALAGVRAEPGFVPLQRPRGIPSDVSQHVADRYFVPVLEDERARAWGLADHFTPSHAARLVASGASRWKPDGTTTPLMPTTHGHIAHPDWHSASWLAVDEIRPALEHARFNLDAASDEFVLLLDYVSAVAVKKGPSTRVVFWFDN